MDYGTPSGGTDAVAYGAWECQIGEEDNTSIVWGVGYDTVYRHQLGEPEGHHLGHQPFRALIALIARTR